MPSRRRPRRLSRRSHRPKPALPMVSVVPGVPSEVLFTKVGASAGSGSVPAWLAWLPVVGVALAEFPHGGGSRSGSLRPPRNRQNACHPRHALDAHSPSKWPCPPARPGAKSGLCLRHRRAGPGCLAYDRAAGVTLSQTRRMVDTDAPCATESNQLPGLIRNRATDLPSLDFV